MTKRSLTRLINQGKLRAEKPNGRYYVRERDIVAMCEASATDKTQQDASCHNEKSQPASISGAPALDTQLCGSSGTERKKLAREQANMRLAALKKPTPTTAPTGTSHQVVPISRANSSSRKL